MTPKEKAQELVNEMLQNVQAVDQYNLQLGSMNLYNAKQCALIVVDELIKWDDMYGGMSGYLIEVKEEIGKL